MWDDIFFTSSHTVTPTCFIHLVDFPRFCCMFVLFTIIFFSTVVYLLYTPSEYLLSIFSYQFHFKYQGSMFLVLLTRLGYLRVVFHTFGILHCSVDILVIVCFVYWIVPVHNIVRASYSKLLALWKWILRGFCIHLKKVQFFALSILTIQFMQKNCPQFSQ